MPEPTMAVRSRAGNWLKDGDQDDQNCSGLKRVAKEGERGSCVYREPHPH